MKNKKGGEDTFTLAFYTDVKIHVCLHNFKHTYVNVHVRS